MSMLNGIGTLAVELFLSSMIFIFFALMGQTILAQLKYKPGLFEGFVVGFSVFAFTSFLGIEFFIHIKLFIIGYLVLGILLILAGFQRKSISVDFQDLIIMLGSLAILGTIYSRFFSRISKFGLTTVTSGNNDLGSYILQSGNLAVNGFTPTSLIANSPLGTWAHFDHSGIMMCIAFLARLFSLQTFQITLIFLFSLIIALAFMLLKLTDYLSIPSPKNYVIIFFTLSTPYLSYIIVNGFIAQLVGILELGFFLGVSVKIDRHFLRSAIMTLVFIFEWFTSPEFTLITFGLCAATYVSTEIINYTSRITNVKSNPKFRRNLRLNYDNLLFNSSKHVGVKLFTLVTSFVVSMICLGSFRQQLIHALFAVSHKGVAGWNLNVVDPLSWFSIHALGSAAPPLLFIFFILFLTFYPIMRDQLRFLPKRNPQATELGLYFSLNVITLIGFTHFGFNTYQTWKLTISLSVFFIPLAIFAFSKNKKPISKLLISLLMLSTIANITIFSSKIWNSYPKNSMIFDERYVSDSLVKIISRAPKSATVIGIDTSSMFTNMILPTLLTRNSTPIIGPNYFGPAPLEFERGASCLLLDQESIKKYPNLPLQQSERYYFLVGKCGTQPVRKK